MKKDKMLRVSLSL